VVEPVAKGSFTPEQATGKPDSPQGGDVVTAWAPSSADGQREWLELTYDGRHEAVGIIIYEACGTGAVDRVTAYAGGEAVDVWAGVDPVEPRKEKGISVIGFKVPVKTERVRIHIDSPRLSGWNEFDAVGLLDCEGKVHWAVSATASSTYGR
jgi:hypothetical protein